MIIDVASNEIKIYYDKYVVGRISIHDPRRAGFRYDPRWLETNNNFPLSVTLPLETGEFEDNIIIPWLTNLLPEGQQLTTLSRVLGLSASDSIGILLEIGQDTAGAISFGEPNNRSVWDYVTLGDFYSLDIQQEALERHFEDLKRRPFLAGVDGLRISLAGGQEKTALAVLDNSGIPKFGFPGPTDLLAIPKNGAPSTIIIKPDNPNLPYLVENEAYCLNLAKAIGIQAVECAIVETTSRNALAVLRYDRCLNDDNSIRRLHQEDFAQANSVFPWQKYEQQNLVSGLNLNNLLLTGKHLPPPDNLKLIDQVIFSFLVANTDAHAKNYSIILSGKPSMAPMYDVSSVLCWDHVNQYHAQKIAGRKRKPSATTKRHWIQIAEQAGLSTRGILRRVQELVDKMVAARVEVTEHVSSHPGTSHKVVEHIAEIVEKNALRIAGRLKTDA